MTTHGTPSNCGAVVSLRGSVVDVRFELRLPPIDSVLYAGAKGEIVMEVLSPPPIMPPTCASDSARAKN